MKILHYVDEPDLAWRHPWLQLLVALETLGHENVLLCPAGGLLEEAALAAGISCRVGKASVPWLPSLCRRIGQVVGTERPQVIHTRLSAAAAVGGYWGKKFNIPVVCTIDKYPKARYYRHADWIVGCSAAVSGHMAGLGFAAEKIITLHNPVDARSYQPDAAARQHFRRELKVSDQVMVFLGLGRFVGWKGFDDLIQACGRIAARANWQLWLVGDGPERQRLTRLIKSAGLEARTKFFGFAQDVKPFLWAADLFIQPSREPEGFSLALLEAMAAGLPAIATDIGGTPDLLRHGLNGWLMKPGDVAGLAVLLGEALDKGHSELSGLASQAQARAGEFDTTMIARQTASLYEDIAAGVN